MLKQDNNLLCVFYLLLKVHSLEYTSGRNRTLLLARAIVQKRDVQEVKTTLATSKKDKVNAKKRKQAEQFIETLVSTAVNEEKYEFLDEFLEVALVSSESEKRNARHMGVHTAMVLLSSFGKQCKSKSLFIEELRQNTQSTAKERKREAKEQVNYAKKALNKLRKVLVKRSIDVMPEIKVVIADTLIKMQTEGTLQLIIDKSIARVMAQFLHDKNKTVKKRALSIVVQVLELLDKSAESEDSLEGIYEFMSEIYDETHVTRILQMAYNEVAAVAVKAIQALSGMYKKSVLDDTSVDFACRLVLRRTPRVACEAAKFIVQTFGQGKILGLEYELKKNSTVFSYNETAARRSILELTQIIGRATSSLAPCYQHKAISDSLEALEKETVSVFDLKSLSNLLSRGEREQRAEWRADEQQQDAACHMFCWAARKIDGLRNTENAESEWDRFRNAVVGQVDYLVLTSVNALLPLLKHTERVRYVIKAVNFVSIEAVRTNGINLLELRKIIETLCAMFSTTNSEKVVKAISKVLHRIEKETDIEPELGIRIEEMQGSLLEQVRDVLSSLEGIKRKASSLMKLSVVASNCSPGMIRLMQDTILPLLSDKNLQGSVLSNEGGSGSGFVKENVLYIIKGVFMMYANAFVFLCQNPNTELLTIERFEQLRQDVLAIHVACMKMHEENLQLSGKLWTSLANLIAISSNDGTREKHNNLYYDPDNMILAAMTEVLAYFVKAVSENDEEVEEKGEIAGEKEVLLGMSRAMQTLALSCEAVFHTELSVLYLAIFGSNKKNSLTYEGMGQFVYKLSKRCVSFKGKSMYYIYIKEAILTCFNYDFQYAEVHSEELLKRIKEEKRNIEYKRFYSLLRAKELMKLVLAECHFFASAGEDEEELEKAKTAMEQYNNFVVDLLKESLRTADNFPLLEIVQMGVLVEVFGWERLNWLLQLFDALSQHVLKVDESIKEEDEIMLKEFRNELLQRIAAKRIKRTPLGKAIPRHAPSLSVVTKRTETTKLVEIKESEGDEGSEKKEEGQKRERPVSITGKRKSTRKRLEF